MNSDFQEINNLLLKMIPKEEFDRVMKSDSGVEISSDFLGFVDTYYYLSKLIPKHWTVIDFGCAKNAQSYFFKEHFRYIAVEPYDNPKYHCESFQAPGTELVHCTTGEFLKMNPKFPESTFAICNFVPNWFGEDPIKLVHERFRNCYTFYPQNLVKNE